MRAQSFAIILALFALLGGCDEEETIRAYRAPKDPPIVLASNQPGAAVAGGLKWTAPPSWKQLPAGQMRVAAFAVNDAQPPVELTVIPLGPEAGALVPNVNRWEAQLGLPPSPQEKVEQLIKKESINGLDVMKVDLAGADKRMLAAIVPFGGRVWYFKMMGPADVVASQAENFDTFIHSLAPSAEAPAAQPPAPVHVAHLPSALRKWKTPDGWKEIPDSKPPRMIAFAIGDDANNKTEMVATRFGGNNAGSFLDNVNRWRGQLGLPPVEQLDPNALKMRDIKVGDDAEGMIVEFHNPAAPPRRMTVAMTSAGDDLWFFKLTGPADSVEKQHAAFEEFLKSLEFEEGRSVDRTP